jgi:hypothetical protein
MAALRTELAVPVAAASGIAALFGRSDDLDRLASFVRRNAVPLGLLALGVAWLGLHHRGRLGDVAGALARQLSDGARDVADRAAAAALAAAGEQIGRPATPPDKTGGRPEEPSDKRIAEK